MKSTTEQQAVIDAPRLPGATVVLAGAGSGKTTTLVHRLERDAQEIDPNNMVVITFTQKAAEQLKSRLRDRNLELGFIGTLHAWALQHVRRFGAALGYDQKAAILPEDATERQIKSILARLNLPKSIGPSHVRQSLLDPNRPCDKRTTAGLAAHTFRAASRSRNELTFETVLAEFLALIQDDKGPTIDALYVDEYQDTAPIDDAIYRAVAEANPSLFFCVVGDANQSIYGFRGAEIDNIITLASEASQTFTLSTNFRSAPAIVIAANRLIEHNQTGLPLTMQAADPTRKAEIRVTTAANRTQEAEQILQWLRATAAGSKAVLTRYNEDADFFADYFTQHGLAVQRRTRDEHAKPRALAISALNALINPQSAAAREWAENYANARPHLFNEAARQMRTLASVALEHANPTGQLAEKLATLDLGLTASWLIKQAWTGEPAETILALLEPEKEEERKPGMIHIGTIHSAKGLEWDAVAIAGLEQQTTPRTPDRTEEERRLFYVGITRARHGLHLSSAATVNGSQTTPSQFIAEAL
jgi:DNA helicase-2/ATP-dependent DNA helicase PcrA